MSVERFKEARDRVKPPLLPGGPKRIGGFYWFEEDCEWAFVAMTFPETFTSRELEAAEIAIRDNYPEAWEKWKGRVLQPNESRRRDIDRFRESHAHEMQAVAATYMSGNPAVCLVWACKGGRLENGMYADEVKTFLVSTEKYETRWQNPVETYILRPGDMEVEERQIRRLEAKQRDLLAAYPDALIPTGRIQDLGNDKLLVTCVRAGDPKCMLKIDVEVPVAVWNSRDLSKLNFVNEDGTLWEAALPAEEAEACGPTP